MNIRVQVTSFSFFLIYTNIVIYFCLEALVFQKHYSIMQYANWYRYMTYGLIIYIIIRHKLVFNYRTSIAVMFWVLGSKLNTIAMQANGGKMPVYNKLSLKTGYYVTGLFKLVSDPIHIEGTINTKYKILTDIIDTGYCVMSLGDILVRIFVFIILYEFFTQREELING